MFSRALILFVATLAFADTTQELIDLFGSMASALSEDNPAVFLRAIDPSAPGYAALARNVNALANQNELTCSIEIVKQEGDGRVQTVELDWLLEIKTRITFSCAARRRSSASSSVARTSGASFPWTRRISSRRRMQCGENSIR